MKRRILGPLVALVVVLAPTACGSAKAPDNSNAGAGSGKLVVWDWKSSDKNAQNFVAKAKAKPSAKAKPKAKAKNSAARPKKAAKKRR